MQRLRWGLKVLLQDEITRLPVRRVAMMLKVLLDHFFRDVARAPCAVAYRPEVPPPVLLPQLRELFPEAARSPPLEPLDQV